MAFANTKDLRPFDPSDEITIESYLEYLDTQFSVIGIEKENYSKILLAKLGVKEFDKLRRNYNKKLSDISYGDLKSLCIKTFGETQNPYLGVLKIVRRNVLTSDENELMKNITDALEKLQVSSLSIDEVSGILFLSKIELDSNIEGCILRKAMEKSDGKYLSAQKLAEEVKLLKMIEANKAETINKVVNQRRKSDWQTKIRNNKSGRKCFRCGRTNHLIKDCRVPINSIYKDNVKKLDERSDSEFSDKENDYNTEVVGKIKIVERVKNIHDEIKIRLYCEVNGKKFSFVGEADSGCKYTLVSRRFIPKGVKLEESKIKLEGCGGGDIKNYGTFNCSLMLDDKCKNSMIIVTNLSYNLIGRIELRNFELIDNMIKYKVNVVKSDDDNKELDYERTLLKSNFCNQYKTLVSSSLGEIKDYEAYIPFKKNAKFSIIPERKYACAAAIDVIDLKLDEYIKEGVLVREEMPIASSPLIPIIKNNMKEITTNNIRFVGDYTALNKNISKIMMKMRNIQTELNKLAKFKNKSIIFSKFDLADGYSSIKIAEKYQKYVCLSTHRGIFRMTRLGQGLASAPMSFQEVMNLTEKEIWRKIKEYGGLDDEIVIMNYFDDLLIATTNINQMWIAVMSLGEVLDMKGFRINPSKAEFLTETVEFLGHKLNGNEVSISDSKSEAIKQLKVPNSREELRSVLGMLNYHLDYTPSLTIIRNPLDRVLKLNEFRPLNEEEVEAFHSCINAVVNSIKLVQIDKGESLIVETDSSNFAIAGVLKCSDGRIARCFSRNLRGPELNYPIQHKECLAIIESIKKFKYWLLLQKFQVITDHQSLEILFRRDNEVSRTAANRLKRWMYELIQYDFEVKFVGGKNVATADCLTRLINQARENYLGEEIIIGKINKSSYAVDCEKIRNTMDEDYLKYKKILEEGEIIDSFIEKKHDMIVENNLIFIGNKLLIPKDVQKECLQLLHATHASPPKMKARAREEMFWKTMTVDIENYYKKCDKCQLFMKMPPKVKDQWPVAIEFLERIHMDACKTRRGGVNVLVLQDAFSGFTDLFILNSMDPYSVRKILSRFFSDYGIPKLLVSDQGTNFANNVIKQFLLKRNVAYLMSGSNHQSSNGRAERCIQTFKSRFDKCYDDKMNKTEVEDLILRIKMNINSSPVGTRNYSPHQLIFKKPSHPILKENFKLHDNSNTKYKCGQLVKFKIMERTYSVGKIVKILGDYVYQIEHGGRTYMLHQDNIRHHNASNYLTNIEQPKEVLKPKYRNIRKPTSVSDRVLRSKKGEC